jgi:hypothetical protein
VIAWNALYAPKGTPKETIQLLNAEINKILAQPESRQKLKDLGFDVGGGTPEQLAEFGRSERRKWGPLIAAVASGQIGVGGRLGSTVVRAIADQAGLAQRVASTLDAEHAPLPPDFRDAIDVTAQEALAPQTHTVTVSVDGIGALSNPVLHEESAQ